MIVAKLNSVCMWCGASFYNADGHCCSGGNIKAVAPSDLGPIPHDTGDHMRKDAGKPRFDLLPPEPLFALADLYAQGAKKYSARGWEAGMSWGRCFGAMMRHAWKFWRGEDFDEETGAHHMIAVMWNAAAIYTYFVRKIGTDDRYKVK